MLVVDEGLLDSHVACLPEFFRAGDILVVNDTQVIPARLDGFRGAARVQITLDAPMNGTKWRALAFPARKLRPGDDVVFPGGLCGKIISRGQRGEVLLDFHCSSSEIYAYLDEHGTLPLPPYISRTDGPDARDLEDYQTIYARHVGAVAAPTAGLHFSTRLFERLEQKGIKGNIIIGIVGFSAIAWITGLGDFYGVVSPPPSMTYLFKFDLGAALSASMVTVIFTLFFIDFFDTAGTLTSVANVSGKIGRDGKIQDIDKAMLSDSVSTVAGAMMGTSTVTTYVESAAGVKAGGRTGMTSLVIGILFLLCLFFSPLATSLPKEIDGAALIYIATLFVRNITDIEWDDISEAGPAVLAMIAMPFTYSISHGIALAFISYAAVKLVTGKFDTSPAIWVIAIASVVSFAI